MSAAIERPVKVLIVEDNPLFREVLRETLRVGWRSLTIFEAGSMAEGRRLLRECVPDLVLLDIGLPDGNGLDLAEQIRREFPAASVMVCSSHGGAEYREEARRRGVTRFLCKQELDWDEVHGVVDGIIGGQSEEAMPVMQ